MYRYIVLIGLILALLAFYLLTSFSYNNLLPLDYSLAQIFVAPIVVLIVFACRVLEPRIPFFAAFALLCGLSLSSFYRFRYPIDTKNGGVLVAQLADDKMFNKTRIFREKINSNFNSTSDARVRSLHQSFSSIKEATDFLEENRKIGMLIWGSQRWIQIAFQKEPPLPLRELGVATDYYGLGNLEVVRSIPVIGLSYEPLAGTSRFISDIALSSLHDNSEIALLAAGLQRSGWTASSHRGYAWWRLGNNYLNSAISEGKLSLKALKCAQNAYRFGLGEVRPNDNPELRAALFNNYGVSIAIQALIERRPRLLYSAMQQFRVGYLTLFEKDPYKVDLEAGRVSYDNLVHLIEAGAKKKSHRFISGNKSKIKSKHITKKKSGRKNSKRAIRERSKGN